MHVRPKCKTKRDWCAWHSSSAQKAFSTVWLPRRNSLRFLGIVALPRGFLNLNSCTKRVRKRRSKQLLAHHFCYRRTTMRSRCWTFKTTVPRKPRKNSLRVGFFSFRPVRLKSCIDASRFSFFNWKINHASFSPGSCFEYFS